MAGFGGRRPPLQGDRVVNAFRVRYFAGVMWRLAVIFAGLILVGCDWDQVTHRADKPLSLAEARKEVWVSDLPFPSSATNVYYLFHAGGMQEHQWLVRFTVDDKDLSHTVDEFLAGLDKTRHTHDAFKSAAIPGAPASPDFNQFAPMPWWNPGAIDKGFYRGTTAEPLYLWVDVEKSTIYFCETD